MLSLVATVWAGKALGVEVPPPKIESAAAPKLTSIRVSEFMDAQTFRAERDKPRVAYDSANLASIAGDDEVTVQGKREPTMRATDPVEEEIVKGGPASGGRSEKVTTTRVKKLQELGTRMNDGVRGRPLEFMAYDFHGQGIDVGA